MGGKFKKSFGTNIDPNRTLKEAVQQSVPRLWALISPDVDWPIDLDGAVELCLDADRPVSFGYMTKKEYENLNNHESEEVNGWAREVLKNYF